MPAIAPPTVEDEASLFSLASEYLEAATILDAAPVLKVNVSLVTYYLIGHAAELLLKSFLYKKGIAIKDLTKEYGHDLKKLVKATRSYGLSGTVPLDHVEALSKHYKAKNIEYRQLIASQYPPRDFLLAQVQALERQIFSHIATFNNEISPSDQPNQLTLILKGEQ